MGFVCPYVENENDLYTTEDCGDCHMFWDCEKGLKECLNDDDFKDCHNEIKHRLMEMR